LDGYKLRQVSRIRGIVGIIRITPIGWGVLLVVGVSAIISQWGPASWQTPAFVLGVAVLLGSVAGGLPNRQNGRWFASLAARQEEFGPRKRDPSDAVVDSQAEADLWRAEKERYDRPGR
jgi:hypothetical protein